MMRPITCLSLMAALGAGLYLYQEKHTAQLLDREINRTMKQADQSRERIGLLKAEWALLNEPERLQGLANDHLQLQSLQPVQFTRLEDLPSRLPAISATPVMAAPIEDVPLPTLRAPTPVPVPVTQAAPAQPTAAVQPARPAPPVQLAAARPAPAPLPKPQAPHVLAAAKPKDAEPAPALVMTAQPAPAPRPYFAPVMPAYAPTPVVIHAPTVQTASVFQPQPAPFVGSALGMARTMLAAPVPVASAASMGYATGR